MDYDQIGHDEVLWKQTPSSEGKKGDAMKPTPRPTRRGFCKNLAATALASQVFCPWMATAQSSQAAPRNAAGARPPDEPLDEELGRQARCFKLVYDSGSRYVNDHCFIRAKDGRFHVFHIVGPAGKGCYDLGSEVSFGHAVSDDLHTWQRAADVLSIDPTSSHEPDHIFAPYVSERGGTYYLFYAGINVKRKMESMCLACSQDLFHWEKHTYNPVFRPSRSWAEYAPGSGIWGCCRDSHVIAHPDYGYILYYVTWIKETQGRRVALGAAVSENLVSWQDAGPVMIRDRADGFSTTSMESPCVVPKDGRYYLFYKHRNETRLVVSDNPLQFSDKRDAWFSIAHAAEIFAAAGQWYISSCSRDLLDLSHKKSDRTKGLFLAQVEWGASGPAVVPLGAPISREGR